MTVHDSPGYLIRTKRKHLPPQLGGAPFWWK